MNINTTIVWDGDRFLRDLQDGITAGVNAAAEVLQAVIVESFGTDHGGTRSAPGDFPNSQTGFGRNSIQVQRAQPGEAIAYVGTDVDYLRYLHYGAHISPHGTALAIPLAPEAVRLVEKLGSARAAIQSLLTERNVHWQRSKHGRLLVRDVGGRHARGVLLFLLTTKTIILKARPWGTLGPARAAQRMEDAFVKAASEKMAAAQEHPF